MHGGSKPLQLRRWRVLQGSQGEAGKSGAVKGQQMNNKGGRENMQVMPVKADRAHLGYHPRPAMRRTQCSWGKLPLIAGGKSLFELFWKGCGVFCLF